MKSITIFPAKMEAIGQALDIFGESRVLTGEWNEPVRVSDLTADEAAFAKNFFSKMDCEVMEVQNGPLAGVDLLSRDYRESLRAIWQNNAKRFSVPAR